MLQRYLMVCIVILHNRLSFYVYNSERKRKPANFLVGFAQIYCILYGALYINEFGVNKEPIVVLRRDRCGNHSDRISVKCLLHHRFGMEHILPVHVDDVAVAMVTLQQHLEHRQVVLTAAATHLLI